MDGLKLSRWLKARLYPWLPSRAPRWHAKRRKGLAYRIFPEHGLECQREQDRIFWTSFLHPKRGGQFLEIGGDGVTGSHTLGLELLHGWDGDILLDRKASQLRARGLRKCRLGVAGKIIEAERRVDLIVVHRPSEFGKALGYFLGGKFPPKWIVVENPEPESSWCQLLEKSGYRLKFFCHDDEYFQLSLNPR